MDFQEGKVQITNKSILKINPEKETAIAFIQTDHQYVPRLITDATQSIIWQWQSDTFGVGQAESDPDHDSRDPFRG